MEEASVKRVVIILGAVVVGLGAYGSYIFSGGDQGEIVYRFSPVNRGAVTKTVSASGRLNAVVTVKVGSQISGQIRKLNVDYNSPVRAGQVIARIDPDSFEAKVSQARADLEIAKATRLTKLAALARTRAEYTSATAGLLVAKAEVAKAKASLVNLTHDFDRKRTLRKPGFASESVLDQAHAAFEVGQAQLDAVQARLTAQRSTLGARKAQVQMAESDITHAGAQIDKSEAALKFALVNLERTYIRSPVDGVVIGRNVDVGQTVAASLQSPTLFILAQDLRHMQVETSIDEADIGQVELGQKVNFEVDSFPGQTFAGQVSQIRKQAVEIQHVITYIVVVKAENPDLRLLPGMTAHVQIVIRRLENVLKVPDAAFRFRPTVYDETDVTRIDAGVGNSQTFIVLQQRLGPWAGGIQHDFAANVESFAGQAIPGDDARNPVGLSDE